MRVEIETWGAGVGGEGGKVRGCDSRRSGLFVPQDGGGALGATHSRAGLSGECVERDLRCGDGTKCFGDYSCLCPRKERKETSAKPSLH